MRGSTVEVASNLTPQVKQRARREDETATPPEIYSSRWGAVSRRSSRGMKRSKDLEKGDSAPGPHDQAKRVAVHRGEMAIATCEAFLPASKNISPPQPLDPTLDDALTYLHVMKHVLEDDKSKYYKYVKVMKDFKEQRIDTVGVIIRVKDLLKDHKELVAGFKAFLPKGFELTVVDDEQCPKTQEVKFDPASKYIHKIKIRFSAKKHVYKAFLEILRMYRQGNKSLSEVYVKVAILFNEHADLLQEFNSFLTWPDPSGTNTVGPARCSRSISHHDEVEKVSVWSQNRSIQAKALVKTEKSVIGSYGDCDRVSDRQGDGVLEQFSSKVEKQQRKKSLKKQTKSFKVVTPQPDLTNCESCTPSYRLLPESYKAPISRHQTDLARNILNDKCVSRSQGYNSTHRQQNKFEVTLFLCEDDRAELDVLIESNSSTIRRLEDFLNHVQNLMASSNKLVPDDRDSEEGYLTAIHLRCIKRIYGQHRPHVVDMLRKNSLETVPVILQRLKQKQEDWLRYRTDMNKVWAEICAKNNQKSLDFLNTDDSIPRAAEMEESGDYEELLREI